MGIRLTPVVAGQPPDAQLHPDSPGATLRLEPLSGWGLVWLLQLPVLEGFCGISCFQPESTGYPFVAFLKPLGLSSGVGGSDEVGLLALPFLYLNCIWP
jgi:hypothetical protein